MAKALIFSGVDIPANHSANFWVSIRIHQKYMRCASWRKIRHCTQYKKAPTLR